MSSSFQEGKSNYQELMRRALEAHAAIKRTIREKRKVKCYEELLGSRISIDGKASTHRILEMTFNELYGLVDVI
jgi:hypothetical protein